MFRGIGFYLVGAWTVLQVVELLAEPAGLPPWSLTALLYVAVLGFPVAVWVSWRYELTDHGLARTRTATGEEAQQDYSLKASDYVIMLALLGVVGAVAWQGLGEIRSDAKQAEAQATQQAEAEREALENSVAVLPFSDMSLEVAQSYLGDGIADTVLHVLSQVDGLTVTARTSSFAFRDKGMTISEIASQLDVAHILEGSVQRAGDQLRIIARLIDAGRGQELWSGNFDRGVQEIFAVQDEIAREVVSALGVVMLADDRERLTDEYRPDLEAYEQYVLARREIDQGTATSTQSAVTRLEQAIEIDPDYALAYTALAKALFQQARVTREISLPQLLKRQEDLVDKALDLDPTLAEAWNVKSSLHAQRKEWDKAGEAIERALELNPNSAEAWSGYWNHLMLKGDPEGALQAIRRAVELDPESIRYQTALAQQLFNLSRAEEAIYTLRETVRRHPDVPDVYVTLSRYLNQVGQAGEAMWYLQAIHRRDPGNIAVRMALCQQHWQLWNLEAAAACQRRIVQDAPGFLDAQKWLHLFEADFESLVKVARAEVKQQPRLWYPKMQLADGLAQLARWQEILELVPEAFPELMSDEPSISEFSQWGARRLAEALLRTGEVEQAHRLVDATLVHFEKSRRLQAGGWMAGPEDALLLALINEDEKALASLEKAIRRDWMFFSHAIIHDSAFDRLRDDPRFGELVDRLSERLADERAWYEAHKDDLVI
ncbi:MAG: tetratricopeptide repeat protein [Xanthomonadales bacterium]|nr:tetratricopeptide repeat protein [Xanthomonadales bacterium]